MNKDKLHIVADVDIPFLEGVLEPYAQVSYRQGQQINTSDLAQADALLIRTRTQCNASLLEGSPLRMIATATIGYDHIDMAYCAARGIEVATAAGCNARAVLQYVMGALSALSQKQHWTPEERTLGVIGMGNVGSLIMQYGKLFGFSVVVCDPPKAAKDPGSGYVSLPELLDTSDIISLHIPLTRNGKYPTAGMAGDDFFARIRSGSVFINTSRGGVMSDDALLSAIERGVVSASVIDTWNHEPDISEALLSDVTYATPHIAGYSQQGKAAGTAAVVRAVARKYGLPLTDWYPESVPQLTPDTRISWTEMSREMPCYFDIEEQSGLLKSSPAQFEAFRNGYPYRTEYF